MRDPNVSKITLLSPNYEYFSHKMWHKLNGFPGFDANIISIWFGMVIACVPTVFMFGNIFRHGTTKILQNHPHDESFDGWSVCVLIYVSMMGWTTSMSDKQKVLFRGIRMDEYQFNEEDNSSPPKDGPLNKLFDINGKL